MEAQIVANQQDHVPNTYSTYESLDIVAVVIYIYILSLDIALLLFWEPIAKRFAESLLR